MVFDKNNYKCQVTQMKYISLFFRCTKKVNYSISFHVQGDQTTLPNMHYSLPFQNESETAVPHLNRELTIIY